MYVCIYVHCTLHNVYICTYMYLLSYQLKLIKMRAKLSSLNHCTVLLLSRAAVNLYWYWYIHCTPDKLVATKSEL